MLKDETINNLYDLSLGNKDINDKSSLLGCFYCGFVFKPEEIYEYADDRSGKTALCPNCSIDSVISLDVILKELGAHGFDFIGNEEIDVSVSNEVKNSL